MYVYEPQLEIFKFVSVTIDSGDFERTQTLKQHYVVKRMAAQAGQNTDCSRRREYYPHTSKVKHVLTNQRLIYANVFISM